MKIVKPNRATRTYTQHLVAEPAVVFPLLCPVREADWIDGWSPTFVMHDWESRINRYLRHGSAPPATGTVNLF